LSLDQARDVGERHRPPHLFLERVLEGLGRLC
jgi:hypothetical protein